MGAASETTLTVASPSPSHAYAVVCGSGLWVSPTADAGKDVFRQALSGSGAVSPDGQVLVVADATVANLYQHQFVEQLKAAFPQLICHVATVPVGELAKDWATVQSLLSQAQQAGFTRSDAFIALGGGVVSDVVGLVAALYYRGARFVAVPTSLLAMVDASVGGKVAVNGVDGSGQRLKNAYGVFYPPHAVVMDTDCLATLPQVHVRAGLAEVFKTALLEETAYSACDSVGMVSPEWAAFRQQHGSLWQVLQGAETADALPLKAIIPYCVAIKAGVVALDPHENGQGAVTLPEGSPRMWLNLGHTFAHAYEAVLGEGDFAILHGDAVALGVLDAFHVAQQLGHVSAETAERVTRVHGALRLATGLTSAQQQALTPEGLLAAMAHDKKHHGTSRRLVLPQGSPGHVAVVSGVDEAVVRLALLENHFHG